MNVHLLKRNLRKNNSETRVKLVCVKACDLLFVAPAGPQECVAIVMINTRNAVFVKF